MAGGLFDAEAYDLDEVEVWPENWTAWRLFCDCATQWRIGPNGGPTGLDYTPLMRLLDCEGLGTKEWRQTFDDVRVLESAALDQLNENRKDRTPP